MPEPLVYLLTEKLERFLSSMRHGFHVCKTVVAGTCNLNGIVVKIGLIPSAWQRTLVIFALHSDEHESLRLSFLGIQSLRAVV